MFCEYVLSNYKIRVLHTFNCNFKKYNLHYDFSFFFSFFWGWTSLLCLYRSSSERNWIRQSLHHGSDLLVWSITWGLVLFSDWSIGIVACTCLMWRKYNSRVSNQSWQRAQVDRLDPGTSVLNLFNFPSLTLWLCSLMKWLHNWFSFRKRKLHLLHLTCKGLFLNRRVIIFPSAILSNC